MTRQESTKETKKAVSLPNNFLSATQNLFLEMNENTVLKLAAYLGAFTVALGAFGAHGLKPHMDAYQQGIFEKGIFYQFIHVLALLGLGLYWNLGKGNPVLLKYAACFFPIGILFFSGSLYVLALRHLSSANLSWVGPITPIGGICFIIGWILLALSIQNN